MVRRHCNRKASSLTIGSSPYTSPGYSRRQLRVKINGQALLASTLELHRRVGWASTNKERFRVGSGRCGQRPASFRKKCHRSCDTQKSYFFAVTTEFEFHGKRNFDGFHQKFLQTKTVLIASLNILHSFLVSK